MAFTNIKKKKIQSILIAVIILVSALIFSSAMGILSGINSPYEKVHTKLNASHLIFLFDNHINNPDEVENWWKSQDQVASVSSAMSLSVVSGPKKNGKKIETEFYLCDIPQSIKTHDKLLMVEGDEKDSPGTDEIWIPTAMAYSNDIKVGEKLEITVSSGTKVLTVSGIVVDPIFSTTMINPTRAWVAPGTLSALFTGDKLETSFLGVRLKDLKDEKMLLDKFEDFLGKPMSGFRINYTTLKMAFLMMYQIIGAVLLLFSVILLLIAMYILSSTITDTVVTDYKTIGILKTQGFTPKNVVLIYVIQMAILSLIALPVGICLSNFVITTIMQSLVKSLGIADLDMSLIPIFLTAFFILLGLICFSAFLSARKAGRVKPAEAIKHGSLNEELFSRKTRRPSSMWRLPLISYLGINQLLSSKKQIIFSFVTFCVTVFAMITGINCYNSLKNISTNSTFVGFDNSDITITKKEAAKLSVSELAQRLKADKRVRFALQTDYIGTGAVPADKNNSAMSIIGTNYAGNMDELGFENIEGKNPTDENQISIGTSTAKMYNKEVGDDFSIYIDGKLLSFKITGIYQSFNNMGQGYRMQTSAVKRATPSYEPNTFLVKLKDGQNKSEFIRDMEKLFGDSIDARITSDMFDSIMNPIMNTMGMSLVFICCIFLVVLVITIYSSSILSIHKLKKNFGIFKTIGMTPVQVRFLVVVRYLIVGIIAIIIGTAAGLYLTPVLMTAMCSSMGVVSFPMSVNILQTILVIPFALILALASSWFPSGQILKINPRSLVLE